MLNILETQFQLHQSTVPMQNSRRELQWFDPFRNQKILIFHWRTLQVQGEGNIDDPWLLRTLHMKGTSLCSIDADL